MDAINSAAPKWDPGPWAYDPELNRVYSVPTNMLVATAWLVDKPSADPAWPANACLIAAAPEMYDALAAIVRLSDSFVETMGPKWEGDLLSDACEAAKPILAKAEGRS